MQFLDAHNKQSAVYKPRQFMAPKKGPTSREKPDGFDEAAKRPENAVQVRLQWEGVAVDSVQLGGTSKNLYFLYEKIK